MSGNVSIISIKMHIFIGDRAKSVVLHSQSVAEFQEAKTVFHRILRDNPHLPRHYVTAEFRHIEQIDVNTL